MTIFSVFLILAFILLLAVISLRKRKEIVIGSVLGGIFSLPLFFILGATSNKIIQFIGRFIFINLFHSSKNIHPDASIILWFILPLYGAFLGFVIGFIFRSLIDKKKLLYKKVSFYLAIILLFFMLSSAIQPSWTSDSSNENSPPLEKVMCEWVQGCDYFEKSLCSESDLVYPSIPLDELPSETTYYCDSDKLEKQFPTEEELVNGKCAVNVKGKEVYWDPFNHPTYGGYSFNNGKIYFQANLVHEKTLCSNAGEIRYRSGCAC